MRPPHDGHNRGSSIPNHHLSITGHIGQAHSKLSGVRQCSASFFSGSVDFPFHSRLMTHPTAPPIALSTSSRPTGASGLPLRLAIADEGLGTV